MTVQNSGDYKALSALSYMVDSQHRGTISDDVDDERSRDRDGKSAVRMTSGDRHIGWGCLMQTPVDSDDQFELD